MAEWEQITLLDPQRIHWLVEGMEVTEGTVTRWPNSGEPWLWVEDFRRNMADYLAGTQSWKNDRFLQVLSERLRQSGPIWTCRQLADFLPIWQETASLIKRWQESELSPHIQTRPFSLAIDAEGDCLLLENLPLFLSQVYMEVPTVPVRVCARHPQWEAFRSRILDYEREWRGVYAPLLHVDLQDIRSWYSGKRFELIREHLAADTRTILDLGAHWGYMSARCAELGHQVTAVERYPEPFEFMAQLQRASGHRFRIVQACVFDFVAQESRFDTVLALALFQHFIRDQASMQQLQKLLNTLEMKQMFFMPHQPDEVNMDGAFWNPAADEFVAWILENSCLNHAEQIGTSFQRQLFHLWH